MDLTVINPFSQEEISRIKMADKNDLNQLLNDAFHIHYSGDPFLEAYERKEILLRAKELMKIRRAELVETAVLEGGKPLSDTEIEIDRAINGIQLAIEGIGQLSGQEIPMNLSRSGNGKTAWTTMEAKGVVAAISAFNHPVNIIVHQVFTAVAAGCPIIVKPSLKTPLSCIKMVEILHQAGLPEKFCQVLICEDELTQELAKDHRIAYLSFIGSAKVGWMLKSNLAPGVHCVLEHGGAAPVIVEADAELEKVIPSLTKGGFYHAGQVCVSVQRVFVNKDVAAQLTGALAEAACNLVVGDPSNPGTEVGPLISGEAVNKVEAWVAEAIDEGAELVCGGKKLSNNCFAPTILLNPSQKSKVSTEEIFGPVICIYTVENLEQAIQTANILDYKFQAAVFTTNINKAMQVSKKLNAKTVLINDHTAFRVDWMPFGGIGQSGYGTGGILQSMKDMSTEKLTIINSH